MKTEDATVKQKVDTLVSMVNQVVREAYALDHSDGKAAADPVRHALAKASTEGTWDMEALVSIILADPRRRVLFDDTLARRTAEARVAIVEAEQVTKDEAPMRPGKKAMKAAKS